MAGKACREDVAVGSEPGSGSRGEERPGGDRRRTDCRGRRARLPFAPRVDSQPFSGELMFCSTRDRGPRRPRSLLPLGWLLATLVAACGGGEDGGATADDLTWSSVQGPEDRVTEISGFRGPESVRYDPDQDVYFVSNFNGDGGARDGNGFISRVGPEGEIESLRFMTGTEEAPLHAPRGMYITGDTLWAADVDGVHGFHRRSGEQLRFADLTRFDPGFLNDVAAGPRGILYVTDTGESRLYRISGDSVRIAVEDSLLGPPNGITWDGDGDRFVLAPWGGAQTVRAWSPGDSGLSEVGVSAGGNFDGVEVVDGRLLLASQADSSLRVLSGDGSHSVVRVPGRPADIGVDTRRRRVAVPYIALDRVDVWRLPASGSGR